MSLLDLMRGLDTSGIADARGSISASVNGDSLQGLLQGGAAQTVLGVLGDALGQVRSLGDAQSLLGPILGAVGSLQGGMSSDHLPIADFAGAIGDAVNVIISLIQAIEDGDISKITLPNGKSVTDMVGAAAEFAGRYTGVNLDSIGDLRGMIDAVDSGAHTDGDAIVDLAMQLLVPFDHGQLGSIRSSVDHILTGAASIQIPPGATAPLAAALEVVATAAASGNEARLNEALRDLERARQNTLELFRRALTGYVAALEALDLARHLGVIGDASQALRTGEESVLEFMSRIKEYLAHLRQTIESATATDVKALLDGLADAVEAGARQAIEGPIDRAVEQVKDWVRGLFAHIPLRHYRAELTNFIHGIAQAIKDADLDRFAREARAFLDQVESLIDGADLAGAIQGALGDVKQVVDDTLGGVKDALETIVNEVNAIADTASGIIEQAATQLEQFQQTVEEVATLIESIQFEQASAAVIDRVHELRTKAEELLSAAPIPDSMRPLVEQLIQTLDNIDFDSILSPVHDAAREFNIPDEVMNTVNDILDEAGRLAKDLITPELISSIDEEIQHVVDEISKLDPSALFAEVGKYIDEAADFIEGLDPRPAVHELRAPFDTVLEAIDAVKPDRLLAPVIDAYDNLMSGISLPTPESLMQGISNLFNSAGESLGSQLSRPLEQLTGGSAGLSGSGSSSGSSTSGSSGSSTSGSSSGGSSGSSSSESSGGSSSASGGASSGSSGASPGAGSPGADNVPPQLEEVHAGDLIRLLGYLPAKLREALHSLESGALGDVVRRIDSFSGGLARDLRRVAAELWAVEERLAEGLDALVLPLGDAQIRAQLAIGAHFKVGHTTLDVNASMMAVAMAGPGPMRHALAVEIEGARNGARSVIRQTGGSLGIALEHAAEALERSSLARLGSDADGLLAALDPEPVAAELDALVNAVLARLPVLTDNASDAFQEAMRRLVDLVRIFNPVTQAEKFLKVLDVVRDELDILNPRRLASELGEVHMAIRETIAAYDPDIFAQEVYDIIQSVAAKLRTLDPANLLGDLNIFSDITSLIENASPAQVLSQLDTSLDDLGDRLESLDLDHLVDSVEQVPDHIVTAVEIAVKGIRDEVKALLESIRYASSGGGASASASLEVH
jgi:hypothetical protein